MSGLLGIVKSFNRKERYFLVRQALGNPEFKICDEFRQTLSSKLSLNIPANAYTAMDYHLDWIYASLELFMNEETEPRSNEDKIIHASAEDIDFLVAFEDKRIYYFIFLEAKGVTLFNNEQLQRKVKRLSGFFGNDGKNYPDIVPYFAIVSPKEPQKIKYEDWPRWAYPDGKVTWLKLEIDPGSKKVVRCDDVGNNDKKGKYWIAKPGEY
jgi:hypothetical protein